jgi:NAD(P)-dependent dehydrogenase (short-subunit alcohol dehydrogenase family)
MLEIAIEGRALVTGGGQGVGAEVARTLAAAGAEVLINDLVAERCESVADEIRAAGGRASALPFDVTDYEAVSAAVTGAGTINVLVNNAGNAGAGSFDMKTVADSEPSDWERYLKVNLDGVMHCTRAALPSMIEARDGRIITVVSDSARIGEPYMAAYAAAKAGAAGFTRSVAKEVGRYGITANSISLGTMRTPTTSEDLEETNPEAAAKMVRSYIIRRRGLPSDVANLVAFLASPMAPWLTGQTIPLNGGYSIAQ